MGTSAKQLQQGEQGTGCRCDYLYISEVFLYQVANKDEQHSGKCYKVHAHAMGISPVPSRLGTRHERKTVGVAAFDCSDPASKRITSAASQGETGRCSSSHRHSLTRCTNSLHFPRFCSAVPFFARAYFQGCFGLSSISSVQAIFL